MPTLTANLARLSTLIQPEEIRKQGLLTPDKVLVSSGIDHAGEEALYVYLVFPNRTSDAELAWRRVKPLVAWVHDTLWRADEYRRYPYVRVKRKSEMKGEPI
jgi:hypothetical protein